MTEALQTIDFTDSFRWTELSGQQDERREKRVKEKPEERKKERREKRAKRRLGERKRSEKGKEGKRKD